MSFNRQKIKHFAPSKTTSNLSNSMFAAQSNQPKQDNTTNFQLLSEIEEKIEKPIEQPPIHDKKNEEFVQKLQENNPNYFNHLKGYCACGKCICGKCRCEIIPIQKLTSQPPKSSYQTQFKYNIPYENNKLDYTLTYPPGINMNKRPIDEKYQSITKSAFKQPSSSQIQIIKAPHPQLQKEELSGNTTYNVQKHLKFFKIKKFSQITKNSQQNQLQCSRQLAVQKCLQKFPLKANHSTLKSTTSIILQAKILQYLKLLVSVDILCFSLIILIIKYYYIYRSPMSPSQFPFLGSTTNRQAFQKEKFRYPSLRPAKQQLDLQYPKFLWKSINATDYQNKSQVDCPGRAFAESQKIE